MFLPLKKYVLSRYVERKRPPALAARGTYPEWEPRLLSPLLPQAGTQRSRGDVADETELFGADQGILQVGLFNDSQEAP